MITFECYTSQCRPSRWTGCLEILERGNPCEAEVNARGSRFHLIAGSHSYGNYVCIPNLNIGTELASLKDEFWNQERLQEYSHLSKVDIQTVVSALSIMADYLE